MADLIDRKAVMDYLDLREHDATERDWRSGANEISRIRAAIAALPAQGVSEIEERKFYHDEWPLAKLLEARSLGNGLLTDDGEAWRYRLTHSDARGKYDVLFRPTRKIAALEPAEAGGVEAHDEQLGVWADELMADLVLNDLMDLVDHDYDTKVGARRTIIDALKSANQAKVPAKTPAPVDALVKAAEPFAYEIDAPAMKDDRPINVGVTIGDHRRLRAALAAIREGRT